MRLFVSVNWTAKTLYKLENLQNQLKEQGVTGYWRRRDNLHLTLKFLGEVDQRMLHDVHAALEPLQKELQPFEVTIERLGVFPLKGHPRILWIGAYSPELYAMQRKIQIAVEELGISVNTKPFEPHITLASGEIRGLGPVLNPGHGFKISEEVSKFNLMESSVLANRRVYQALREFHLRS